MATTIEAVGLSFYPALSVYGEDHKKEFPLTKLDQFCRCSFKDISIQRLTTSPYKKM